MRIKVIIGLALIVARSAFAMNAESSRFVLDLHYESSGEIFPGDSGMEVWGLSSRWTALTTILKVDSDFDGLPDVWEEIYGLDSNRKNDEDDPDCDGWTNIEEYNAGRNPILAENYAASQAVSTSYVVDTWIESGLEGREELAEVWMISGLFTTDTVGRAPDADKDGMPDWYETLYGLNPNVNDAHLDCDGDGRINIQEYNAGTNPILIDDWTKSVAETSEAFETDTRVYYTGGSPTFDVAFAVIKVSNGFVCDTGGLYYDWDGDGIPNWWEKRFARDGSKTGLVAVDDDDADGASNYAEFVAYTDPSNNKSKFVIGLVPITVEPVKEEPKPLKLMAFKATIDTKATAPYKLCWQSAKDRLYDVYSTSDLSNGWDDAPVATLEGTGDVIEYRPKESGGSMFFRVSVRLSY